LNEGGKWATSDVPFNFPSGTTADTVFKNADIRSADLDFDKQIDTLRSYQTVGPSGTGIVFAAYINKGDGNFDFLPQTTTDIVKGIPSTFSNSDGRLVMADMNGDRLQDIVLLQDEISGGPRYWPSKGFGKFDDSTNGYMVTLTDGPNFNGQTNLIRNLELSDLNGDGLPDLYYVNGSQLNYWLNKGGTSFGNKLTLFLGSVYDPSYSTYRLLDIDGDGLQELLFYTINRPTPDYLPLGFNYIRLFEDNTAQLNDSTDNDSDGLIDEADEGNNTPNLLASITNGIGKTTSMLYNSHIVDVLRDKNEANAWQTKIPYPQSVLRQIDVNDGLNNYRTLFKYHDGYYDGVEKEFRGFYNAEQQDVGDTTIPDLITRFNFDLGIINEAKKGKLLIAQAETTAGDIFYRETTNWESRLLANGTDGDTRNVTYAFASEKVREVIEKGTGTPVSLKWQYEYDDYGNTTKAIELGRMDAGWDDERVTISEFSSGCTDGITNWILDKPIRAIQTDESENEANKVSEQKNYYDGSSISCNLSKGNLTKTENWVSGSNYIASVRNQYDQWGNITHLFDPLYSDGASEHYREIIYDPVYYTFPIQENIHVSDSNVLSISATYDEGFGVVTNSVDFNDHTTTYGYEYNQATRQFSDTRIRLCVSSGHWQWSYNQLCGDTSTRK